MLKEAASISLVVTAMGFLWLVAGVRGALDSAVAELRASRQAAVGEIQATRRELMAEVRALRQEVKASRQALEVEVSKLNASLVSGLEDLERQVSGGLTSLTTGLMEEATILRSDASQVLKSSNRLVELMTPQILGLTAASKVTAGELAQTARTWRRETPAIAENVRETTANVRQATKLSKWHKLLLIGSVAAAVVGAIR